ncbi:MAG TPA: EF-hand domain-containing protein [Elainellaceae cyanobacterium]
MLTEFQKRKLIKLFSMYDTTHNGSLSHQDFEKIAKRIIDLRNWSRRSPRCQILSNKYEYKWKRLLTKADKAHDQEIHLDEWYDYHDLVLSDGDLYEEEIESLMKIVIDALDTDEDGKISQHDWGNFLSVYSVSPVYMQLVFPQIDSAQKGFLDRDEILKLVFEFYHGNEPDSRANFMFGPY